MLTGQAKTDYQREYMRRKRMGLTGSNSRSNNQEVKTNREYIKAKLSKVGLTLNNSNVLDLTKSKSKPLKEGSNAPVPLYNPSQHRAGDKVMMRSPGGKLVETIIPELDAGGNPMYGEG